MLASEIRGGRHPRREELVIAKRDPSISEQRPDLAPAAGGRVRQEPDGKVHLAEPSHGPDGARNRLPRKDEHAVDIEKEPLGTHGSIVLDTTPRSRLRIRVPDQLLIAGRDQRSGIIGHAGERG